MKNIFFTIVLVKFFCTSVSAQVSYSNRPLSLQVYPRDSNDSATVEIAGEVNNITYTTAIFTMHKNGVLTDSSITTLNFNGSIANFTKSYSIHAEKSHFRFKMFLYNGSVSNQYLRVDSVCSGDVYLINGQSNGQAVGNGAGTDAQYLWVRSFGSQNNIGATCLADTTWGMANGANGNNRVSIGVWAARLGRMLADSSSIPVAFINGSQSGTRIIAHLPLSNHMDLNSIYGRLLYRTQKANVTNKIKAMFWYQGESDTDTAYLQYANRFNQLYTAWKQDYLNLSKIIVIQTRPGCLITQTTLYHPQLREILRTLPSVYPDITVTSTVGIPNFDGCHFYTVGYQQLAYNLYEQYGDEFIGKAMVPLSDPPQLLQAVYTNNNNTELSLVFNQSVAWPSLHNGYNMKDYIYITGTTNIVGGTTFGDTLKLQLTASTNASKISYLPGYYYAGANTEYQGPWLLNSKNLGTPSFHYFNISNNLVINADRPPIICNNDSVIVSTLRTGQNYQWYLDSVLIPGAVYPQFSAKNVGTYKLVVTDNDNATATSNSIIIVSGVANKPIINTSTNSSVMCQGDTVTLTCNDGVAWQWSNGETTSSVVISTNGDFSVKITADNGCTAYSDTLSINVRIPVIPVISSNKNTICRGDSILLSINPANSMSWNNGSSESSIYISDSNYYSVTITDSIGCTTFSDSVSFPLKELPEAFLNQSAMQACTGQSIIISSVNTAAGYLWTTGQTTNSINVNVAGEYGLTVTDLFGCKATAPPVQVLFSTPVISIVPSGNITICIGSKLSLSAAYVSAANSFQWYKNNVAISGAINSSFTSGTAIAGTYSVRYTDIYGCTATSSNSMVSTASAPTASFTMTNFTDVCQDTVATLTANSAMGLAYRWQKNSIDIPGANSQVFVTNGKGTYRVITTNSFGCSKTASIKTLPVVNPIASITASGPTTFCNGDSVVLSATAGSGNSYQWYRGTPIISGAIQQNFVAKTAANYKVRVTNSMGCTTLSASVTIRVNSCKRDGSFNGELSSNEIIAYPQPFSNYFTLRTTEDDEETYSFVLRTSSGGMVLKKENISFDNKEMNFFISNLSSGVYFYQLISNSSVFNGTLVKD